MPLCGNLAMVVPYCPSSCIFIARIVVCLPVGSISIYAAGSAVSLAAAAVVADEENISPIVVSCDKWQQSSPGIYIEKRICWSIHITFARFGIMNRSVLQYLLSAPKMHCIVQMNKQVRVQDGNVRVRKVNGIALNSLVEVLGIFEEILPKPLCNLCMPPLCSQDESKALNHE